MNKVGIAALATKELEGSTATAPKYRLLHTTLEYWWRSPERPFPRIEAVPSAQVGERQRRGPGGRGGVFGPVSSGQS